MAADLQSASDRVEAERRRLDLTVRSLGDALVVVASDATVAVANPRARELVPDAVPGYVLPEDPAPLDEALAGEVVLQRDGRTLAVTAARLETGGIVWTIRDVSERARLERLKSEFVATASHELRSPLTSIKGFVELLGPTDLTPRQREWLDIILVSTNRLVDLVNDLLDVARVEAGRIEVHRRPTDLGDIVDDVATLLRPRLEDKAQTLRTHVPTDLPRVLIDPIRIRQVLTNLLTNAHLYTRPGGHIGIDLHTESHAVVLEVSDTGRGMDDEQLEHVFDRFYRGGEESEGPTGTGLGLAIVKALVDLHGGTISVASTVGQGTTFTVRLPRVAERAEPVSAHAVLDGRRVLVVDDEPDVARLVAERLRPYGVVADLAHDGREALERLRTERFDAVTLDILMPGMTGFEVLRALRAEPELQRIPVVVVSVFSGREALSGEWVVAKPIDAEELADALGAAVLAGRVRVLAVGREAMRLRLSAALDELGIEHEWAGDAAEADRLSRERYFEVAAVDAGLPDIDEVLARLDLRGRRLRRSVVVFADQDGASAFARLDAEPVLIEDAGAVVLGLLDPAASRAD
jgi:signal transduction histidine kinase/CheY-like chemotaxis protein